MMYPDPLGEGTDVGNQRLLVVVGNKKPNFISGDAPLVGKRYRHVLWLRHLESSVVNMAVVDPNRVRR